jgi:nitrous oxide reductase accessory protein NosL
MAVISLILCFACANFVFAHEDGDGHEGASPVKCRCGMDRSTLADNRKVEAPAGCHNCGMDRTAFASSRALITFTDGTTVGTCSINCAHDEVTRNASKKIRNIKIADYTSKKLIDAKKAIWVIGGRKNGVMSATAKWAFEDKAGAERFVKENGGKIAAFDEAWKAAGQ